MDATGKPSIFISPTWNGRWCCMEQVTATYIICKKIGQTCIASNFMLINHIGKIIFTFGSIPLGLWVLFLDRDWLGWMWIDCARTTSPSPLTAIQSIDRLQQPLFSRLIDTYSRRISGTRILLEIERLKQEREREREWQMREREYRQQAHVQLVCHMMTVNNIV